MGDILLVDDSDEFREVLAEALSERGYSVRQATNGREAIQQVLRKIPRMILLDYSLPDTTGVELLSIWRGRNATKSIPVIVITGHVRREFLEAAAGLGVTDYLLKSMLSLPQLLERLEAKIGSPSGQGGSVVAPAIVVAPAPMPSYDPSAFLRSIEMRAFPGTVAEVLSMAEDPRASLTDLDKVLRRDPMLSAKVLAASQTAAFMRATPTRNIGEALQVLGMSAVVRIIAAGSVLQREDLESPWGRDVRQMWSHSIACAFLSQHFHDPKEEAFGFVLGLLHELAELLAIVHVGKNWMPMRQKGEKAGWSTMDTLSEVFKSPFPRLAREVLMRMRLPTGLSTILREHYDAEEGEAPSKQSTRIVRQAHHLSALVGRPGSSLSMVAPLREKEFELLRPRGSFVDDLPKLEKEIATWEELTGVRETGISARPEPLQVLYMRGDGWSVPDAFEALLRRGADVKRVQFFDGLYEDADLKIVLAEPSSPQWEQAGQLSGKVLLVHQGKADRAPGKTVRTLRLPLSESKLDAIFRDA